jgi:Tfp pilus assembly protein PilE
MGQQQLLLVILVTIIVGIATVVAINTFGSSAENSNRDAVRNDVASIATAAQAWYIKPDMLGGGGNTFTGITFNDFGFSASDISEDGLTATNLNGTYVMTVAAQTLTIVATPSSNASSSSPVTITGTVTPGNLSIAEAAAG